MRRQLRKIPENLAAAGVFHHPDPQLGVGGVDRNIDGADVHFDDAGNILVGHVGEGDIAAEQKAHAAVVILEVQRFPHPLRELIDKAEDAFIGAAVLPVHQVILKLQSQLVIFRLADGKTEGFFAPQHLDAQAGIDHIKAVIQDIPDNVAVDGKQPVPGPDAGPGRRGMGSDRFNSDGHIFSPDDQI